MPDDPTPTDPTQEAVRRLLADARHAEPMPAEVAQRLDRVLADLGASRRRERSETATVVPLASRRRRRLATGLVAAAAVVAVGVALPGLIGGGLDDLTAGQSDSGQDAGAGQDSGSGDEGMLRESAKGSQSEPGPAEGTADPAEPDAESAPETRVAPPTIRPDRFAQDARAAQAQSGATFDSLVDLGCGGVPLEGLSVTVVRYADRQGYLVFRSRGPDEQRVDLYLCPEGDLERRALIPAP